MPPPAHAGTVISTTAAPVRAARRRPGPTQKNDPRPTGAREKAAAPKTEGTGSARAATGRPDNGRAIRHAAASSFERAGVLSHTPSIIRERVVFGREHRSRPCCSCSPGDSLYTVPPAWYVKRSSSSGCSPSILGAALCVVRHAEHLAVYLGEPLGTLILTLAVTAIEAASISAVMIHSKNSAHRGPRYAIRGHHDHHERHGRRIAPARRLAASGAVLQSAGRQYLLERHHPARGAEPHHAELHADHARPTLSLGTEVFLGLMCVGLYSPSSRYRPDGIAAISCSAGRRSRTAARQAPASRLGVFMPSADRLHGAARVSRRAVRPSDRRCDRNSSCAGRAERRHHCSAGRDPGSHRCGALGDRESLAAVHQHLLGLAARDHRPYDSPHAGGQSFARYADLSRPAALELHDAHPDADALRS